MLIRSHIINHSSNNKDLYNSSYPGTPGGGITLNRCITALWKIRLKQLFIQTPRDYIRLLRSHIQKENNVLFPFIDTRLSVSEQKDLFDKFENHEEQVIGKGRHEELHSLLEKLAKKYLNC